MTGLVKNLEFFNRSQTLVEKKLKTRKVIYIPNKDGVVETTNEFGIKISSYNIHQSSDFS